MQHSPTETDNSSPDSVVQLVSIVVADKPPVRLVRLLQAPGKPKKLGTDPAGQQLILVLRKGGLCVGISRRMITRGQG